MLLFINHHYLSFPIVYHLDCLLFPLLIHNHLSPLIVISHCLSFYYSLSFPIVQPIVCHSLLSVIPIVMSQCLSSTNVYHHCLSILYHYLSFTTISHHYFSCSPLSVTIYYLSFPIVYSPSLSVIHHCLSFSVVYYSHYL